MNVKICVEAIIHLLLYNFTVIGKQKDSLETRAVFWGGRNEDTSKQRKMVAFVRNCLVKMTPKPLWIITNAPRVL